MAAGGFPGCKYVRNQLQHKSKQLPKHVAAVIKQFGKTLIGPNRQNITHIPDLSGLDRQSSVSYWGWFDLILWPYKHQPKNHRDLKVYGQTNLRWSTGSGKLSGTWHVWVVHEKHAMDTRLPWRIYIYIYIFILYIYMVTRQDPDQSPMSFCIHKICALRPG